MTGTGLFGKVDQVPGRCYVATKFFYVAGIPLIPLSSWAVVESDRVVSAGFLFQTVTGVHGLGAEEGPREVRVPFSWRSVAVTYLRAVLWVVHGAGAALSLILGWALLPRQDSWQFGVGLLVAAVGGGALLRLSYRVTRASPARAARLTALLGLQKRGRPSAV